jgi:hypothetical protein
LLVALVMAAAAWMRADAQPPRVGAI